MVFHRKEVCSSFKCPISVFCVFFRLCTPFWPRAVLLPLTVLTILSRTHRLASERFAFYGVRFSARPTISFSLSFSYLQKTCCSPSFRPEQFQTVRRNGCAYQLLARALIHTPCSYLPGLHTTHTPSSTNLFLLLFSLRNLACRHTRKQKVLR